MKAPRDAIRLSKFLSYVLRHSPEAAGISLDREGWAEVAQVLEAARRKGFEVDEARLGAVVANSDKKRFTLSEDGARIRAAQGHSTPQVEIAFAPMAPPALLYHGTAETNLPSILSSGLEPRKRHYVHLSPDAATAVQVGRRHGKPMVLRVDSGAMHAAGHIFYRADNGVWLTRSVPPEFISEP
ncbi:MAG TPA: RNA 2'-phosphotransferase [Allosphingosinicella sp.]